MKTSIKNSSGTADRRVSRAASLLALVAALAFAGCVRVPDKTVETSVLKPGVPQPLDVALTPHTGSTALDQRIRRSQEQVRTATHPQAAIEQLGWLFIAKARESFDPGFCTLAEQCAIALDSRQPASAGALLLRGHALHSLHRFADAEPLARRLVATRQLSFDYALLGDILADLGRVDEAAGAYQMMMDLKPDPQGYARVAHIRWIKGDLEGAVEAMRVAAAGAPPYDTASAAWMKAQLARYLWQSGDIAEANDTLRETLDGQTNYAPALLLRGRMLLSEGRIEQAIPSLRQAARMNPLPEYHWALGEALRAALREDEARAVETQIVSRGPGTDPRTCSLYLATRGTNREMAVRLARLELTQRADVFTHDALAWALASTGCLEEAQSHLQSALAEGTRDARLFFHAAVITARAGKLNDARKWLTRAATWKHFLLPSEKSELQAVEKAILPAESARFVPPDTGVHELISAVAHSASTAGNGN